MPQTHRKNAHVSATPIRMASTLLISGKVVTLQRKYTELDMMEAEVSMKPICDMWSVKGSQIHATRLDIPSTRRRLLG